MNFILHIFGKYVKDKLFILHCFEQFFLYRKLLLLNNNSLLMSVFDWWLVFLYIPYFLTQCIVIFWKVYVCGCVLKSVAYQGGRGNWAVYYTSPWCFIITLSYSLTILWTFIEFWLVGSLSWVFKSVSTTNFNLQRGYFLCIMIGDVNEFIGHCLIP